MRGDHGGARSLARSRTEAIPARPADGVRQLHAAVLRDSGGTDLDVEVDLGDPHPYRLGRSAARSGVGGRRRQRARSGTDTDVGSSTVVLRLLSGGCWRRRALRRRAQVEGRQPSGLLRRLRRVDASRWRRPGRGAAPRRRRTPSPMTVVSTAPAADTSGPAAPRGRPDRLVGEGFIAADENPVSSSTGRPRAWPSDAPEGRRPVRGPEPPARPEAHRWPRDRLHRRGPHRVRSAVRRWSGWPAQVVVLQRTPRVRDGEGAVLDGDVGRADHRLGGAGRCDGGLDGPGVQVEAGLVGVASGPRRRGRRRRGCRRREPQPRAGRSAGPGRRRSWRCRW